MTIRLYSHGLLTMDIQHLISSFEKAPKNMNVRFFLFKESC